MRRIGKVCDVRQLLKPLERRELADGVSVEGGGFKLGVLEEPQFGRDWKENSFVAIRL